MTWSTGSAFGSKWPQIHHAYVFVHSESAACIREYKGTTDISAPKSDSNHPAEIAHVGNTILASSVSVDTIDLTCLHL